MDWHAALRARATGDVATAAIVGQRVYWGQRPQDAPVTSVTLLTVSDARNQHLKGFESIQPARVQIDCRAETHKQAWELAEAVFAALVPAHRGNGHVFARAIVAIAPRDLPEPTGSTTQATGLIFRVSMDLIFNRKGTLS